MEERKIGVIGEIKVRKKKKRRMKKKKEGVKEITERERKRKASGKSTFGKTEP